jgi:hypothetical protein
MSLTRESSAGSRSRTSSPSARISSSASLCVCRWKHAMACGSHLRRFFVRHRSVTKRMPRAYLWSLGNDDLRFIAHCGRTGLPHHSCRQQRAGGLFFAFEFLLRGDDNRHRRRASAATVRRRRLPVKPHGYWKGRRCPARSVPLRKTASESSQPEAVPPRADHSNLNSELSSYKSDAAELLRRTLRANIDETESAAIITEQGGQENHRERSQDGGSFCSQFA